MLIFKVILLYKGIRMQTYKFIIKGLVQGVYYRKFISKNATTSNFKGQVKNLTNGDVEVFANIEQDSFNDFVSILKKGSPHSKVSNITYSKIDTIEFNKFSVTY